MWMNIAKIPAKRLNKLSIVLNFGHLKLRLVEFLVAFNVLTRMYTPL